MRNLRTIFPAVVVLFLFTVSVSHAWSQASSLHAFKWNDVNGNGQVDFGDPQESIGIANWPIHIQSISAFETVNITILTDQFGFANFPPLQQGQYRVTEADLPYWKRTSPASGEFILNIDENGQPDQNEMYFGNMLRGITEERDFFLNTLAQLDLDVVDFGPVAIQLTGDTDVRVFFEEGPEGNAIDDDNDGRDEVQTQIVSMNLSGNSPLGPVGIRLRQDPTPDLLSLGKITEQTNNTPGTLDVAPFTPSGIADSYFAVWVEVFIAGFGTAVTHEPIMLQTTIDHKPPGEGVKYNSTNPPVMLFDQQGNPMGIQINQVMHTPVRGKKEIDFFELTLAEVTVEVPGFGKITLPLWGPTQIEVPFEGPNEGDALDDNNNGLDEVPIEMVQLNLQGTSPLGPVSLRLDQNQRSVGGLEEHTNDNPGRLDVEPFAPGTAESFFDVFFEVDIAGTPYFPEGPAHMSATITHKPPRYGDKFFSNDTLNLLDAEGNPTGLRILSIVHCPVPPIWIHGYKWHDVDGDSLMDPEEPKLAGWTVFVDANTDGKRDSTEVSTQTDSLGRYWLHLPAGTHVIAEEQRDGWEQTFPAAPGTHTITLSSGQQADSLNFGNKPRDSSIHGYKWCDLDGDSLWDAGEPPLEDWLIYLDENGNGLPDPGEMSTLTDSLGRYWFHVPPGNYTVAEENREHWQQTFPPPPGVHMVNLGLGQVIDSLNFGNHPMNSGIHGYKWSDLDGDGQWGDGEPPLKDWVIYLDQNDNGQHDSTEVSTRTDSLGRYWFYVPPGSYQVAEVMQAEWRQTHPPDTTYRVNLDKGEVVDSLNFGNQIIATSVGDEAFVTPLAFELMQNYPNPFNPTTTIQYALPRQSQVVVEVFDLLGRRVATLVNAIQPTGFHEVRFDAGDLASGVYVYRIQAGEFSRVRKLILLR